MGASAQGWSDCLGLETPVNTADFPRYGRLFILLIIVSLLGAASAPNDAWV